VGVLLSHPIPLVGLGDGAVTSEHGERCSGIILQGESHFPPLIHGFGYGDVEIRNNAMPRRDVHNHAPPPNLHFRVRVLWELDAKEVIQQIEMVVNPHEGLT
jgi:hypothetical protein